MENPRLETNHKKEKRVIYLYLAIFFIIGAFIALAGYQYHKNFENHFRTNVENKLSLIADLKVSELEHWLGERRGDAETLLGNEVFSDIVKRYFKNPDDHKAKKEIQMWLKKFNTGFNFDAIILTDPQLVKKIVVSEATERPRAYISPGNVDSLRAGKLVFEDFYRDELQQKIFLKILIPIFDVRQLIGIIEFRIDPKIYLYPTLNNWPVPSETSETFIIRREGNEAIYLSELKFQKNTALKLQIPLEDKSSLAVRAVLGQKGFMEGTGYSGKATVAYIDKVPNSPWFLVAQTDAVEVYASLKKELWLTLIFSFGIFLISGFVLGFVWRYQRTLILKERIKSAEALRESEERFRSLYENSTMGIYRTTPDGRILLANDALVKMLGYSSFKELSLRELTKDGYEPTYERKQFIDKIEKHGEVIGFEAEWSRKDGTPVYIRESAKAIRGSDQQTLYYDGTVEDITELKKSELERQVIFEITEGVTTTNNLNELLTLIHHSLAKLIYANNIFVALHDQNAELFSFPYYVDQFDSTPEPVAMAKSCTAYVFRTGKPILITPEIFQQLKEQNEIELVGSPSPSWIGVPLQTPNRALGVLVLQHYEKENVYSESDVQFLNSVGSQIALAIERKKAEAELLESEEKYRLIFEHSPLGILSFDHKGVIIACNNNFIQIVGSSQEALKGANILKLPDKKLVSAVKETINGGTVLYEDTYYSVSAKKNTPINAFFSPMYIKGVLGGVGIVEDITERKRAEEEIRETNEQLLKINAEKDKFFSIIAHDLRGPFSGFLGLTQIMAEELPSLTMAQVQDLAISMKNSATNLYSLLENLLQWARMQQGAIPFTPEVVQLKPLIDECIAITLETAKNKGIDISYNILENTVVFVDSNMLQTVIRNLVSNAIKFTTRKGKISLLAKTGKNNHVEISVRDTGIGMSREMVDNLFRPDVKTSRPGTENEPSTGLGLLLCKEFVEKQGGKIWVESEVGKGSAFYFTIPKLNHQEG